MPTNLGIKEFIERIVSELKETVEARHGRNDSPYLSIKEIELSLHACVKKSIEGGLDISVVQAGGNLEKEKIHEVRIILMPVESAEGFGKTGGGEFESTYKLGDPKLRVVTSRDPYGVTGGVKLIKILDPKGRPVSTK